MAEAAAAPAEGEKKKKSKKPMMIALVVMLAAGGFFGMKLGGGSAKKVEPKMELGEVVALGEFLVNLSDGRTFLKTEISVQIAKGKKIDEGGSKEEGKAEPPAPVRDAVIAVLSAQDLKTISTPEGKLALKRALAEAINEVTPKEKDDKGKDDSKEKPKDKKGGDKKEGDKPEVVDASWDSQTGPVLKVYFTNFATQE